MNIVPIILDGLAFLVFMLVHPCHTMLNQELIPADLRHSIILTSPLKSGSNSTELLAPDFSKPPTCVVTLPLNHSWVLIDVGYILSGLSQIRLFTDNFIDSAHEYLTDIEVNTAEYLPHSIIERSKDLDSKHFSRCGNTGTMSKDTSNAVVDCASPSNVRWVLLKKRGQLNLCYVQILQNTVKPECFQKVSPQKPIYEKTKSNLSSFRFKRYVTFLECLQNCDTERQCDAVAFMPLNSGAGFCNLLRQKESSGDFLCDESCDLRINRCHIGKRMEINAPNDGEIIKMFFQRNNSYALSVEINGIISCARDNCVKKSLFMSDSKGEVHYCGTVDPHKYRILINAVFMCDNPVKEPQSLIFKTVSIGQVGVFEFTSINIRICNEESLFLYQLTSTHSSSTISTSTFIPSTSLYASNIYTHPSSKSTHPSKTSPYTQSTSTKVFSPNNTFTSHPSNQMTATSIFPTKSQLNERKRSNESKTSSPLPKQNYYIRDKYKLLNNVESHAISRQPQISQERSRVGNLVKTTKKTVESLEIVTKRNMTKTERDTKVTKERISIIKEREMGHNQNFVVNHTDLITARDNLTFVLPSPTSTRKNVPFLWIILLTFGAILVLVTVLVVMITFADGRRKMKQWDIPAGGLCPQDNGSQSLIMETSMYMSTTRKLS